MREETASKAAPYEEDAELVFDVSLTLFGSSSANLTECEGLPDLSMVPIRRIGERKAERILRTATTLANAIDTI
jgi:hypothetical protein